MRRGYISRRPRSIAKDSIIFENPVNSAKLAIGPTADRPGPMLFIQDIVAENTVSKSNGSNDMVMRMAIKQTR
jgi:hypothetical protein